MPHQRPNYSLFTFSSGPDIVETMQLDLVGWYQMGDTGLLNPRGVCCGAEGTEASTGQRATSIIILTRVCFWLGGFVMKCSVFGFKDVLFVTHEYYHSHPADIKISFK